MALGLTMFMFKGIGIMEALKGRLHQALSLETNSYRIFAQLRDVSGCVEPGEFKSSVRIPTQPLPPGQTIGVLSEEKGMEGRFDDQEGEPLRFAYVRNLKKVRVPKDSPPVNKAVFAYLRELPDHYLCVLFWY